MCQEALCRRCFATQQLMEQHPPVLRHENKRLVYEIACPPGSRHEGELEYTRWGALPLPILVDPRAAAERRWPPTGSTR